MTTPTCSTRGGWSCSRTAISRRRPCRSARSLRGSPAKSSVREALGLALFRSRRFAEAATEFEAVVEQYPTNDFAHFCLGRALDLSGPLRRRQATPRDRGQPAARPRETTGSTGSACSPPERGVRALVQRVPLGVGPVDGRTTAARSGRACSSCWALRRDDAAEERERLAAQARAVADLRRRPGADVVPLVEDREILCVSQFTLYGDAQGQWPSLRRAAAPDRRSRSTTSSATCSAPTRRLRRPHGGRARERRAGDAAGRGLRRWPIASGENAVWTADPA